MDILSFESRKKDHIREALNPAHQAQGMSGFDLIQLPHDALPEMDFSEVRIDSRLLGIPSPTPFYIAGMTAGHPDALAINQDLASACQARGWALGLGSMRRDLETGTTGSKIDHWENFRSQFPMLKIFANFGITQLKPENFTRLLEICEPLQPQAIAIHCNALQEVLQPEGTPNFKNALAHLCAFSKISPTPLILKETGCGFSTPTLEKLQIALQKNDLKLGAVDVSGLGGTHWGRIEGARSSSSEIHAAAAEIFANWGEPTAQSIANAHEILPHVELWASGGLRNGLDAAKAIALGATQVGYAQPALEALKRSPKELELWMQKQEFELRVALFCSGCKTPLDLQKRNSN